MKKKKKDTRLISSWTGFKLPNWNQDDCVGLLGTEAFLCPSFLVGRKQTPTSMTFPEFQRADSTVANQGKGRWCRDKGGGHRGQLKECRPCMHPDSFFFLVPKWHWFFFIYLLGYSCFTTLCSFCGTAKWISQPHVYPYPLPSGFPSLPDQHRARTGVSRATRQASTSSLFRAYQCIRVNPNLPIHPSLPFPAWCPYICSLRLCFLYFYSHFISNSTLEPLL